jgi:hypothetical protein
VTDCARDFERCARVCLRSMNLRPHLLGRFRALSRWQIPRLIFGPCEHPRKEDKGESNGCNDYCVYDRHDIL